MKLRFIRAEKVVGDVVKFMFEPEQALDWTPGQYMHYLFPHENEDDRGHERWFTISSAPFEGHVAISTRISEQGSSFKRALQNLQPGDEIEADGPEGDFTLVDTDRNYIFVAGGIGITPFRSILYDAYNKGMNLKLKLLYATRNHDIPFKDELDQFAGNNPNMSIEYIVDPDSIDKELLGQRIAEVDNPIVYVSGPKPMVKSFAKELAELGLHKDDIKTDDFPGYEAY
ncbi:MAG TPA: FAD-dependent oxidoreductase [Candidatus Saccharimonadales bacterium]|nr:FAD-dependent oxidoreductase [Candidatus Saccharimonadales bacterium]